MNSRVLGVICATVIAGCLLGESMGDELNVCSFGAKGDGKQDNTAAFQKALDEAMKAGGGTVMVPNGQYRFDGCLTIRCDVTLEGMWKAPTARSAGRGTTLLVYGDRGNETGHPFITLGQNACIKGLAVYYPEQYTDGRIEPYPWCIASNGGANSSIIDVLLVNPYQAVDFGSKQSGRHYIRNLYGQPLRRGIYVNKCYDVGRIENVHFWPFWRSWHRNPDLREWLTEHGEAFLFGRTDWEYVLNTFCFGYNVGYKFIGTEEGACNGNFLGIGADWCETAVLVEQVQGMGVQITNGEFVAVPGEFPVELRVASGCGGNVLLNNCNFWGNSEHIAVLQGDGLTSFNQCHFWNWDRFRKGNTAIRAEKGHVSLMGCGFMGPWPQVYLGKDVAGAVIVGNQFMGKTRIKNYSEGDVQIGLNVGGKIKNVPPGAILIDDDDEDAIELTGEWKWALDSSWINGACHYAGPGAATATAVWKTKVGLSGNYEVLVWVGADTGNDHATNAPYTLKIGKQTKKIEIDQHGPERQWRSLGVYGVSAGQTVKIVLTNEADRNVVADAVILKLLPE